MNTFVNKAVEQSTVTRTENGAKSYTSTLNKNLDLFGMIGSVHNQAGFESALSIFKEALVENRDLALRVLMWARDVRGGSGRRGVFRFILNNMAKGRGLTKVQIEKIIKTKVVELGRFDDLTAFFGTKYQDVAVKVWVDAIRDGNGLAAKWAPRKDKKGAKPLRQYAKLSEKEWRKLLVENTNVVETQMCERKWSEIEYPKVPSVAMSRYRSTFNKRDSVRFDEFNTKVIDGEEKINASSVYPHDIVRSLFSYNYVIKDVGVRKSADAQWLNLPDFIESGETFLPIIDTSGSMDKTISGSIRAIDIAIGLGIYMSERNKSAFKDLWMTFSTRPKFHKLIGNSIADKVEKIYGRNDWDGSTNIEAAFKLILKTAIEGNVSKEDMPSKLIIVSDMQFDCCCETGETALQSARNLFAKNGYDLPQIVFWQVNARAGSTPIRHDDNGTCLVSGFSPVILKSVVSGVSPVEVMLRAVNQERYEV